jgi:hypothetical protein
MYHFPEVFNEPRDKYIAAFLHEICTQAENNQSFETVNAYIGNVHV